MTEEKEITIHQREILKLKHCGEWVSVKMGGQERYHKLSGMSINTWEVERNFYDLFSKLEAEAEKTAYEVSEGEELIDREIEKMIEVTALLYSQIFYHRKDYEVSELKKLWQSEDQG